MLEDRNTLQTIRENLLERCINCGGLLTQVDVNDPNGENLKNEKVDKSLNDGDLTENEAVFDHRSNNGARTDHRGSHEIELEGEISETAILFKLSVF